MTIKRKWSKQHQKGKYEYISRNLEHKCPIFQSIEKAKEKGRDIWKNAQGDDLPEIGREVIAILDYGKVVFAHRPPEYWDGKNIDTGKITRYYPKTYGKGGWNIPDVEWWLDLKLPYE